MGLLELALGGSRVAEQRGGATELRPLMGRRHTMPKEDHTSSDRSFDDLARAMAEGSLSRRGALKLFAGTALAALIPSRALADDDDCVRICHVPFDRETEECDFANAVTRCVSRRERRRHLENHPCDCRGRCANCLATCLSTGVSCTTDSECCSGNCTGEVCQECPRNCSPCNCFGGILNQSTCTCECLPDDAAACAENPIPEAQGCCPTSSGFGCAPPGTLCRPR